MADCFCLAQERPSAFRSSLNSLSSESLLFCSHVGYTSPLLRNNTPLSTTTRSPGFINTLQARRWHKDSHIFFEGSTASGATYPEFISIPRGNAEDSGEQQCLNVPEELWCSAGTVAMRSRRRVHHGDGQSPEAVLLQLLVGGMLRTRAVHLKPLVYTPGRGRRQSEKTHLVQIITITIAIYYLIKLSLYFIHLYQITWM